MIGQPGKDARQLRVSRQERCRSRQLDMRLLVRFFDRVGQMSGVEDVFILLFKQVVSRTGDIARAGLDRFDQRAVRRDLNVGVSVSAVP